MSEPITTAWLAEVGFKYHQLNRQPDRHWLLWLGALHEKFLSSVEDLGIELAPASDGDWFCWLRSDTAHRYSRFIHLRYLRTQAEVQELVQVLTGQPWDPKNHLWGSVRMPREAEQIRREDQRLDRRMLLANTKWRECEKDDTRGGALPEHLEEHVLRKAGKAP